MEQDKQIDLEPKTKNLWAKIKYKRYIFIVLIVILAGVLVFLLFNDSADSPQNVSEKLVKAVIAGKIDDAYKLTSSDFKKSSTFEQLTNSVNQITKYTASGKVVLIDSYVQSSSGQKDAASVVYSVTKDKTYYIRVILEKENDSWKVTSFKASESPLKAQDI